jgi:hypothetical protein
VKEQTISIWSFSVFDCITVKSFSLCPGRLALLIPGLISLASGGLIWLQTMRPFDDARLEPGSAAWQRDGVVVTPLRAEAGGLQAGDIVVAAAGRPLAQWAQALFRPAAPSPRWQAGDAIRYTVLRDGERLEVEVTLGRAPLGVQLARNWSAVLFALITQLITLYVLWRRPRDGAARALFVWASSLSVGMTWLLGLQVYDLVDREGFWLFTASTSGAWFLSWGAILHFALAFPQPHAAIVRRPAIIPAVYAAPFVLYGLFLAASRPFAGDELAWLRRWQEGNWYAAVVYLVAATVVIVQQYRASAGVTRDKIRWLAFAALLSLGASLLLWFLPNALLGRPLISTGALGLLALPYPLALAVALLRHRLFDIDIIIRRTLAYSLLTVTLSVVYLVSVTLLNLMLGPFVVQEQNRVVTALATLAIAALFRPLRGRVQETIDRRFYRRKYDSEQVLALFRAQVREETDVEQLAGQLAAIAQETLQPVQVSVWLRKEGDDARQPAKAAAPFQAVTVRSQP